MRLHTPPEAQGSAGGLKSFNFSCKSFLPLPLSSVSSGKPGCFLRSSSVTTLLLLSSSSWVTRFSQASGADTQAGLGTLGAVFSASSFQLIPSSDDSLLHDRQNYLTNTSTSQQYTEKKLIRETHETIRWTPEPQILPAFLELSGLSLTGSFNKWVGVT